MGEDNQVDFASHQPSRAALVANDLARASTDPGFQLLLRALANIAQEEFDFLTQAHSRMNQEIQRERREMDISNQKAQALDTVVAERDPARAARNGHQQPKSVSALSPFKW